MREGEEVTFIEETKKVITLSLCNMPKYSGSPPSLVTWFGTSIVIWASGEGTVIIFSSHVLLQNHQFIKENIYLRGIWVTLSVGRLT